MTENVAPVPLDTRGTYTFSPYVYLRVSSGFSTDLGLGLRLTIRIRVRGALSLVKPRLD